ncbi:MAG: bifunctional demethylmenaquinone methyltransferase/2-methoxy-6-polyprenyl-1,4-benzoquinol methylase UbiE [Planctomycetota bacterium]
MPQETALQSEPAWTPSQLDNPHVDPEKARRVEKMFAAIAPSYDLNNRVHSFGRDQAWRRAAVKMAELRPGDRVLDVACGTGDLTFAFAAELGRINGPRSLTTGQVTGLDFTEEMLAIARQKSSAPPTDSDSPLVPFLHGDAMALPLPDASVDVVSIAFGIRNVAEPARALAEFYRVLRPGGRLIVLEFTVPTNPVFRLGYNFYCGWLMPRTASLIARDTSGAYKYLPRSVNTFAGKSELISAMSDAGFLRVTIRELTCGIAACYRGFKTETAAARG